MSAGEARDSSIDGGDGRPCHTHRDRRDSAAARDPAGAHPDLTGDDQAHSFRFVASAAVGALLPLSIGVGSTLAKPAESEVYDPSDPWCFQDGVERYCAAQTGTFTVETRQNGLVVGVVDLTTTVDVTVDGADESFSFASGDRTRWTDGEQTCESLTRLRIVDDEVITDSIKTVCH